MSENLHDIDQLFRDGMEGHEDMPGEKVWDAIDARLDKSNVVSIKRKYNNLKRVAAVLLLLLLSVAAYEIFKPKVINEGVAGGEKQPVINNDGSGNGGAKDAAGTAGQDKSAGSLTENDNTASSNNSAQGSGVSNATYDSLSANAGKKDAAAAAGTTAVRPQTVTVDPADYKKPVKNQRIVAPAANTADAIPVQDKQQAVNFKNDNNSTAIKGKGDGNRSFNGKTTVRVKRPVPVADDTDANEDGASGDNTTVQTTLPQLEYKQPATLAQRISKALDITASQAINRQSPDAVLKMRRKAGTPHFNIMPYAALQFTTTRFKEEERYNGQSSGPGGPPPPRPGRGNHREQYKDDEQTGISYAAGVMAEVPLGSKWSVQSGISYTQKSTSIEPKKIYARTDKDGNVKYVFDCSSGYSYISAKTGTTLSVGDSINAGSSKNTLGYIGVPLAVSYKFSLGKFKIIPAVGSVFNFLAKQKIETQLVQGSYKEQQTISNIEGLKSNYITATAGLALEYELNRRMAVNLIPAGNFALTSITKDAAVQSYPNAFGITGGIKIKF